jgi:hypothetical protein
MKEKYISKRKSLLIYGLDTSGKSKELNKVYNRRDELFNTEKFDCIYFSFSDSLAEIIFKTITDDDIELYLKSLDENKRDLAAKNINKQFFRVEVLKFKTKSSYLFIDDLDKFTGKKLEILKDLIRNAKIIYATSKNEKSINKTIFSIIERKGFDSINLKTTNSFDATNHLLLVLMIPFAIAGQYGVVMMLLLANRYLDKGLGK